MWSIKPPSNALLYLNKCDAGADIISTPNNSCNSVVKNPFFFDVSIYFLVFDTIFSFVNHPNDHEIKKILALFLYS